MIDFHRIGFSLFLISSFTVKESFASSADERESLEIKQAIALSLNDLHQQKVAELEEEAALAQAIRNSLYISQPSDDQPSAPLQEIHPRRLSFVESTDLSSQSQEQIQTIPEDFEDLEDFYVDTRSSEENEDELNLKKAIEASLTSYANEQENKKIQRIQDIAYERALAIDEIRENHNKRIKGIEEVLNSLSKEIENAQKQGVEESIQDLEDKYREREILSQQMKNPHFSENARLKAKLDQLTEEISNQNEKCKAYVSNKATYDNLTKLRETYEIIKEKDVEQAYKIAEEKIADLTQK